MNYLPSWQLFQKRKNHTHVEKVGHTSISFWHLLMNLKNKYLLRKLLKWANKKQNNLNIYNVAFKKKIKKNTYRYHYQNLNDIIYSSWDIEQNILKLAILGHFFFLPFYPPKNSKNQNFEKWKILLVHMCTNNDKHMMYSSWNKEWDRQNCLSFWTIFCPFNTPY